jgi:aminoglycoside phosphotransferase family enzyme/predicted kinase
MIVEDQTRVTDFLSQSSSYPGACETVERIDTHSASIFLAGERAYKLKRAVRYDFLDFSSRELRRRACEAELAINRRTAPQLYLAVQAVTEDGDGRLAFDGPGPAVDWLVVMRRFPQEALLDRLAARGALDLDLAARLARHVAHFHSLAESRRDHGGYAGMRWVIDGNAAAFAEHAATLDARVTARLTTLGRDALHRHKALLDDRQRRGLVRQCHGDLHLRNIVLLDGEPTLFDAIEFNDEIACVDVLYDLAFLLMDLRRRQLPAHANTVFNEYLAIAGDGDGLLVLPLFLSCRAAIRAKTSAAAATLQANAARSGELRTLAAEYLAMAEQLITPVPPCLVAIGGLSGSGKSTLAAHLAPDLGAAPGAVVLRSDVLRKSLFGVPATTRLALDAYAPAVTDRVYALICDRGAAVLDAGYAVIADAVYADAAKRDAIAGVARRARLPFIGLWLDAPADTLEHRLGARVADASDATVEVLRRQREAGVGPVDWIRIDASGELDDTLRSAREAIVRRRQGPVGPMAR